MPLTREFKQTIMADLQDREYRAAYLAQAIEAMHGGEFAGQADAPHIPAESYAASLNVG